MMFWMGFSFGGDWFGKLIIGASKSFEAKASADSMHGEALQTVDLVESF